MQPSWFRRGVRLGQSNLGPRRCRHRWPGGSWQSSKRCEPQWDRPGPGTGSRHAGGRLLFAQCPLEVGSRRGPIGPTQAYESFQLGLPSNFMAGAGPDFEADPTGHTMASLTTPAGGGGVIRHGWGQHIGAVVAMSAGNRVTLENYARSHELGAMRQGPDYYFQMYGPPNLPNQTWHHAWTAGAVAAGIAPVKNAVTIVVRQ